MTIAEGDAALIAITVMITGIAEGDAALIATMTIAEGDAALIATMTIAEGDAPLTMITMTTTLMGVDILMTVTVAVAAVKMMAMVEAVENKSTGMAVGQVVDVDVDVDVAIFRKAAESHAAIPDLPSSLSCCYVLTSHLRKRLRQLLKQFIKVGLHDKLFLSVNNFVTLNYEYEGIRVTNILRRPST